MPSPEFFCKTTEECSGSSSIRAQHPCGPRACDHLPPLKPDPMVALTVDEPALRSGAEAAPQASNGFTGNTSHDSSTARCPTHFSAFSIEDLEEADLAPGLRGLFKEAKPELNGSEALWADEIPSFERLELHARTLLESWKFKMVTMSAVITDVSLVIYKQSAEVSEAELKKWYWVVPGWIILTILSIDLTARLTALRIAFFRSFFNVMELLALTLNIVDEIVATGVPFAVTRLVRAVFMLRSTIDALADMAVDRMIINAIGDILYISPENATAKPTEGMLVIEKTHFLPKAFENIHLPITVKGGLIELVSVDMRSESRQKSMVVILENVLIVLGPSRQMESREDALSMDDVAVAKDQLKNIILQRMEPIFGKRLQRPKQKERPTLLTTLRRNVLPFKIGHSMQMKVDCRNLEVRYEDFNLLDSPVCIGARARKAQCRMILGRDEILEKCPHFRAKAKWSFQWSDTEEDPLDESVKSLKPTPSDASQDLCADDAIRLMLLVSNMCAWVDHNSRVSHRGSWQAPHGSVRSGGRRSMQNLLTEWASEARSRLAAAAEDFSDNFGNSDVRSLTSRSSCNTETFTQFFEPDLPEVSAAVRLFKRQCVLERWKMAARRVVEDLKLRRLAHIDNMGDAAVAILENRLGSRTFRRAFDHLMPHDYVLLPTSASMHASSRLVPDLSYADNVKDRPYEVTDLELPHLHLEVGRTQMLLLRQLEERVWGWLRTNRKVSQRPIKRLSETPPNRKYQAARSWWTYAVDQVVQAISPNSKFSANIQHLRYSFHSAWYPRLLLERELCVVARKWDSNRIAAKLRRCVEAVLQGCARSEEAVRQVLAGQLWQHGSEGDTLQGHLEKVSQKYRQGRLRWTEEKERELLHLQVALPLKDVICWSMDIRSQVIDVVTGHTAWAQLWHSNDRLDRDFSRELSKPRDPNRWSTRASGPAGPLAHVEELIIDYSELFLRMVLLPFGPAEVRIHVHRFQLSLLHDHRLSTNTESDEDASLREFLRFNLEHLAVILNSTAPMGEWEALTSNPEAVFDHAESPSSLALPPRHRRGGLFETKSGNQRSVESFLPFSTAGQPVLGWNGLEVSVSSMSVVQCCAPTFAPSLHFVLGRSAASGSSRVGLYPESDRLGNDKCAQPLGQQRQSLQDGGIMFLLRAARWNVDGVPGTSTGILTLHTCALKITQCSTLVDDVAAFLSPQRGGGLGDLVLRPSTPDSRMVSKATRDSVVVSFTRNGDATIDEDRDLLIAELQLRRDRLHEERQVRSHLQTRVFEFAGGAQKAGLKESTKWRVMLCVGDVQVTSVAPYSMGGKFLVSRALVPGCCQHFERRALPLGSLEGPSCRAGFALPGVAGVLSAAASRVLGVDLLASDVPRGPAPVHEGVNEPSNGNREAGACSGAISRPWQAQLAPEDQEEWHSPEWNPSDCVRVRFAAVGRDELELELGRPFAEACGAGEGMLRGQSI